MERRKLLTSIDIKPVFPFDEADAGEGLNNAGIEHYLDRPFASMAREFGQNSLDVKDDSGEPVSMVFSKLDIPAEQIPGLSELDRIAELCLAESRAISNEREEKFFLGARRIIAAPVITVLSVADYNTTGAKPAAFKALAKSTGITLKENSD